jgi:hypothetical protein
MNLPARLRNALRPVPAPRPVVATSVQAGLYLGWGTKGPVLARPDQHLLVLGPPDRG